MQKLLFGFFLIGSLAVMSTFTSCKKESSGGSNEEKIVGKWTVDAAYFHYHLFGTSEKDTITESSDSYLQFNADGTTTGYSEGQASVGTWKINSNKLIVVENGDDDSLAYDIKKLTANELHLYNKETEGENFIEVTLHLKK